MSLKHALSMIFVVGMSMGISAQDLTVKKVKEKYGYEDPSGKMVIKASYTEAYPFEDGVAKVCKDGKWGYIDPNGKAVIPIQFENLQPFVNGRAKVSKGGKWGYIGMDGKAIIPVQYDNIEPFVDGLARVQKGGKYGYITEDGSVYIKPDYNFIGTINPEGYVWVAKGKVLEQAVKGLYHKDKLVVPVKYTSLGFYVTEDERSGEAIARTGFEQENNEIKSNFAMLSTSPEPYIWATRGFFGLVLDLQGKEIVKQQRSAVGMPKEGFSVIRSYEKKKGKEYYVFNYVPADGKSKKLLKKDVKQLLDSDNPYEACRPFENGVALCGTGSESYLVDRYGNNKTKIYENLTYVKGQGYISTIWGKSGFLDLTGDIKIEPTYKKMLASGSGTPLLIACDAKTSMYGVVDLNGQSVVPFKYNDAFAVVGDHLYIREGNMAGVVTLDGKKVIQPRWAGIVPQNPEGPEVVWAQSPEDQKWYAVDLNTDARSGAGGYEMSTAFDAKNRSYVKSNDKYGVVTPDGTEIIPMAMSQFDLAAKAIAQMDKEGKVMMKPIEAYRFNIHNHEGIHNYHLHQVVDDSMWDY